MLFCQFSWGTLPSEYLCKRQSLFVFRVDVCEIDASNEFFELNETAVQLPIHMTMARWVGHDYIFVYKRNNRYDSNS